MIERVLECGLVVWLVTTIIVEGAVFDEVRDWLTKRLPGKLPELIHCHLCAGTWVGFGVALLVPGPFGFFVLDGFLYKAVGHIVLEVVSIARNINAGMAAQRTAQLSRKETQNGEGTAVAGGTNGHSDELITLQ